MFSAFCYLQLITPMMACEMKCLQDMNATHVLYNSDEAKECREYCLHHAWVFMSFTSNSVYITLCIGRQFASLRPVEILSQQASRSSAYAIFCIPLLLQFARANQLQYSDILIWFYFSATTSYINLDRCHENVESEYSNWV